MTSRSPAVPAALLALFAGAWAGALSGAEVPDWSRLRTDHPRLYFNADTWPAVQARAEGPCREHTAAIRKTADNPQPPSREWSAIERPPRRPGSAIDAYDWGDALVALALVQRLDPDPARLERIRDMLQASLDYYHACFAQGKSVNWYARSRMGWLCALDWTWNDLPEDLRVDLARGFLKHVDEAVHGPHKQRQNRGGVRTGYYGDDNLALFTGLALQGTGADDAMATRLLNEGFETYQKVIAHRRQMADDDGGAASATLGYSVGEYPFAEWDYLHCMASAAGLDRREEMAYVVGFSNYILWNLLPGNLEFGYGDTPHLHNRLPSTWMHTHLSHLMHVYGALRPEDAALAATLRERFKPYVSGAAWCVYPFVLTDLEKAPPPLDLGVLPAARFFPAMGQVFMRSGAGPEDTYLMLSVDGQTGQHRHYDAGHFTLYRQGFLALDTGTRHGNTDNLQNYFAQTIAHNCVLIKMPGEKPSRYWNGTVVAQAGGQNLQVGSKVVAFETDAHSSYVAMDLAPVYAAEKCASYTRQILFVMPDHVVVMDRVVSTDPGYAKTWLLHLANEPRLQDGTLQAEQGDGRIFCRTMLPADATLELVGGPGREFLVEGVNYAITDGPSEVIVKNEYTGIKKLEMAEVPELMGRWRLEVRPGAARAEDVFLHLLQVGNHGLTAMSAATVRQDGPQAVLTFATAAGQVTVALPTSGPVGGHLRLERAGAVVVDRELTREVTPQAGLAIVR